ncbi:MrcB Membrane carboxypeptidase (penicillin-binding protein) [Acidimicrobiia bacterium]
MNKLTQFGTAIVAGAVTVALATVIAVPAIVMIGTSAEGGDGAIDIASFQDYAVRSQVFAEDGSLLATLHGVENRDPVDLAVIPDTVRLAILSVEDAEFYNHGGVNIRSLIRATLKNVQAGGVDQGGSTITQQLVKKALLSDDRVLNRKTKEAALAIRLEGQLSKDEILELYLNTVYFGSGAYGVQAAAETYWGKNVEDLSWAEGALLAALIANPVAYDPVIHPSTALERRSAALDRMVANDVIIRKQADEADLVPLPVGRCTGTSGPRPIECGTITQPPPDSYFVEQVKEQLLADPSFGATYEARYRSVFGGGLQIYTTLDPVAQAAAQIAHDTTFPDAVKQAADAQGITTAMVSVDSSTGAVRALVGGPGFADFKYDIATHEPGRQTGSTFKTFVLLTALEQGIQPDDLVDGGGSWPNKGGTPDPYVIAGDGGTLMSVTAASSNGAFVRLGQTVGIDNVITTANRLGVTSQFNAGSKAMPLGVFDVTPLEMASAYSAIPNGGIHETAYFVDRVEDRTGTVIVDHSPNPTRAVSARSACLATEILANNVQSGTGTNARLGAQPAAGKTGTTEGNSNTWFVGYTPYLTTAVWMGIPSEGTKSMGNLAGQEQFGGLWPATIWRNFNKAWLDSRQKPVAKFPTCAPALRPGQPAAGASDPYGILNGGTVPDPSAGPTTTQRSGRSTTTTVPRSTTTRVPRTTTTRVDPTTTTVTTLPPPADLG